MRQIKFRIWNGRNNKMQSWEDLQSAKLSIVNWKNECHPDNRGEFDVMQFTGVISVGGVEIYEGDIVEYDTDFAHYRHIVVWNEYLVGWCLQETLDQERGGMLMMPKRKNMTVIGNIYQHAHLLKGGKNG